MTRETYLNEMDALRARMTEMENEAKRIALDIIRESFPDVVETPRSWCKLAGDKLRFRPDYDPEDAETGDFYEVDIRSRSLVYFGSDLRKMRDAAAINPTAYDMLQRGNTAVFVVWRGREAAVLRFDVDTGEKTGKIAFRCIDNDTNGQYCKIGGQMVYRGEATA